MQFSFLKSAVPFLFRQRIRAANINMSPQRFDFAMAGAGIAGIYSLPIAALPPGKQGDNDRDGGGIDVLDRPPETRRKEKTKKPKMYWVMLYNNATTPHTTVTRVLEKVFRTDEVEAIQIMQNAERNGRAGIRTYSHEIAETKAEEAMQAASKLGSPELQFGIEPA